MSGREEEMNPWDDFAELPLPPSTGQIFNVLIRQIGGFDPPVSKKTLQRFLTGSEDFLVPNKTRDDILDAVAEWIEQMGLLPAPPIDSKYAEMGGIRSTLEVFVREWESWRAYCKDWRMEVPKKALPHIWAPYLRLATIELAVRIAASLSTSAQPQLRSRVLEFWAVSRPGEFLKQLMKESGSMTRDQLVKELRDVPANTVDDWLDYDAKPRDASMPQIAVALTKHTQVADPHELEADLRRLYLLRDVTKLLREHVGDELITQCVARLLLYTDHMYETLRAWNEEGQDESAARFIQSFGSKSQWAHPLLKNLYEIEKDAVWREDLQMVHGPWHTRVIDATRQAIAARYKEDRWALYDTTVDAFGEHADALRAYLDKSTSLLHEGRFEDSLQDLNRIPELNHTDARLHEFVGIMKKDWGALKKKTLLLEEALESFWLAITLDRSRLWSWTGIGHTLVLLGRPAEAIEHLESIKDDLSALDSNFHNALSHAYRLERRFDESLNALEESIKLSPNDHETLLLAAEVCLLRIDPQQAKRYAREARKHGLPESQFRELMAAADHLREHGPPW